MPAVPRTPSGAAVLRADKTAAILDAVLHELAERGWHELTMDGVAARAGVGKPALYRRWRSRNDMVLDCVVRAGVDVALPGDTGSLRDDLLGFARQAVEALADPFAGRVIAAVLAAMSSHPEVGAALAERFREPRRLAAHAAFERAIQRGEIPADADIELATDLLAGPMYMFAVGAASPPPHGYAERLIDGVLRACGAGGRT